MRLLRRILILLLFFALAGGIWGAIYAQKRGFSKTWRGLIEEEFAKRGYYTKIGKVTLGPMQGLVAEDVFFFQDPQRLEEIAFVDNVILDLDLTEILARDLSVNTLDVKDASLSLPLSPGKRNSEMLRVDRFSGRLVVTESQIEIVKAKADLQGIEVTIKGSLHRPAKAPGNAAENQADIEVQREKLAEIGRRIVAAQAVLKEIDQIEFDPFKRPRIEIEFSGDLADLGGLRAHCRIFAENFQRKSYAVQELTASMEFDGEKGRATLKELHLRDAKGDLRLWAEWPIDRNEVSFDLDSSVDLKALITSVYPNPKLGEVVFFDPPKLKVEGVLQLDGIKGAEFPHLPIEAIGEFSSDRIGSRGAIFDGLDFDFSISEDRYYVRNLRLEHKTGSLLANLMFDPALEAEAFRYQSEVQLDPRTFLPFFRSQETQKFLSQWTFNRNSVIYIVAMGAGPDLDPEHWQSRGLVDLRRLRLNNVRFNRLEANYEFSGRTQTYREVRLARPEGTLITPEARYDADKKSWTVTDLKWSLDLVEGMRAFSPDLAERMTGFQFSHRPEITANGTIDSRTDEEIAGNLRRHHLKLKFASDQPSACDVQGRTLPFDHSEGSLGIDGGTIHLSDFKAGLFGGALGADFKIEKAEPAKSFRAKISLDKVPVGDLIGLYGEAASGNSAAAGKLTGTIELSGVPDDIRSIHGAGEVAIREGALFAIPPFDALSRLMAEEISGWSAAAAPLPKTTATLKLEQGILSTDNLESSGSGYRFAGKGEIDCARGTVQFEAGVAIPPPPDPLSRLYNYTGQGLLSEPNWQLKTSDP